MSSELMLTGPDLRRTLDELDRAVQYDGALCAAQALATAPSAKHWSQQWRHAGPLRRLARILRRVGESSAAAELFQRALEIEPGNIWSAVGLSSALEDTGQAERALEVLTPALARPDCEASILARAAALARKLGNLEQCLSLRRRAASSDPAHLGGLIADLTANCRVADALKEARLAISGIEISPELALHCYVALRKFSHDPAEISCARDVLLQVIAAHPQEAIWRARLYRREGRLEDALAEISRAVEKEPHDPLLLREHAWIALAWGYWGRDARALIEGRTASGSAPELGEAITAAEELLKLYGGTLEEAAADPQKFAKVKSPESVFDFVARIACKQDNWDERRGLVMIASSLAAGGAERILATSFRHISGDPRFGWAKLYLFDLSAEANTDFYLPLTGLPRSGITLLNRECKAEAPLSWLPSGKGKIAQAIRNQLECDKPAIVHAWLEPLNTLAGLAALLAGVPRIVLHTHNMRPADLNPDDTFVPRLRDCYRALLARPEVSLVCCAEAAVRDYAQWMGIADTRNLCAVHNGLSLQPDEEHFVHVATAETKTGPLIIGTAFRFSEVKRPLRWVDAAALVLAQHPQCHFIMFGDGELRTATEQYIQSKGLARHFTLPGLVSDLNRRLPELDLFVLSSRTEALPNVLLEAQLAGVPVVAYDVGGVAETMIDGVTGRLVKQDSAEALSDAIVGALNDRAWRVRASSQGRAFVAENFSIERMVQNLSTILLQRPGFSAARSAGALTSSIS